MNACQTPLLTDASRRSEIINKGTHSAERLGYCKTNNDVNMTCIRVYRGECTVKWNPLQQNPTRHNPYYKTPHMTHPRSAPLWTGTKPRYYSCISDDCEVIVLCYKWQEKINCILFTVQYCVNQRQQMVTYPFGVSLAGYCKRMPYTFLFEHESVCCVRFELLISAMERNARKWKFNLISLIEGAWPAPLFQAAESRFLVCG